MNKTVLSGVSALALCAALSAPAVAACVVTDNGDVTNVVCSDVDNDGVAVDEGDNVDVDVLADAVVINGNPGLNSGVAILVGSERNIVFDADAGSQIGAIGDGVGLFALGDITVNSAATVGAQFNGIVAISEGDGDVDVANSGLIVAQRGIGLAALAIGNGDATVSNSGSINAGDDGFFAQALGTGNVDASNEGDVIAAGNGMLLQANDGDITANNSGILNGGLDGINALTLDGNVDIINSGTITGIDDGLDLSVGDGVNGIVGAGNITVDNSGIISGGDNGIHALINGTGDIDIANSGTLNAAAGDGIRANLQGDGDIIVTNSGPITAGDDGIDSTTGNGNISVTNSGEIVANGDGVASRVFFDGDISVENTGAITATTGSGVVSQIDGDGDITVSNSGSITSDDTDGIISGIEGDGDITVTNGGTITAADNGIESVITGNGNISVTNTGSIAADGNDAILSDISGNGDIIASNAGTITADADGFDSAVDGNGTISISNSGLIQAGSDGILSDIGGNGVIEVSNSGSINAEDNEGIEADIDGDGAIIVTNTGSVTAGEDAVQVEIGGAGDITVANSGSIVGGEDGITAEANGGNIGVTNAAGALVQGDLAIEAFASGSVTIDNAGVIRDTLAASGDLNAVFERVINAGAGDAVLNNSGVLIGNVAFDAANAATVNNSGDWYVGGDNDFTGPADAVNNTGTIRAFGTTNFNGLEDFNNAGGLLTMLDGDDVFETVNTTGNFTGGADSVLAIDAKLGNDSGADLADLLTAENFRGQTGVAANDLLADVPAGFNPEGVIFASFAGETDDDAFFLIGGPVDKGLFTFDVFLDEPNKDWVLASAPDATFFELPSIITGAQQLWHDTAGAGQDRLADLRTAISEQCDGGLKDPVCSTSATPGIWASIVGASTERSQQQQNFALLNQNLTFDISYDQASSGIVGGFDIGDRVGDGAWVAGVMGGYVRSDLDFDASTTSVDYSAALVGAYAGYADGGFFADAKVIAQFGEADYKSVSGAFSEDETTDFTSIGGTIDVGYRMPVGGGFFVEPGASLAYVNSDVDDLAIFGEVVQFGEGDSLRGRLGARIGTSFVTGGAKIEPFVGLNILREFQNQTVATVVSNGFELEATDEIQQNIGEVAVGVSVLDLGDSGLSGFVKGNAQFGESDFENYTGNAGVRLKF